MLSSCDNVDRTEWRSCNEACNDTRVGVPANTVMTKNDEPTRDQWFYARAGQGIIAGFVALFLLVLVAFFCDKLCCRRNSMHLKKNHYLNHSMWTHPATSGIYNVLILLEILCNLLLLLIWVANLLPYVVFEREAREFQSFHFLCVFRLCHSRISLENLAHSYLKKITRKSTLEYTIDHDVNSNTNARTQVRKRNGHFETM